MSTAKSRDAYVDTSALIAFADQSDSYHLVFRNLFSDPPPLVTTPLVVTEGHAWFLRRYDQIKALHFLSMLEVMTPLTIMSVGVPELAAASDLIRQMPDQALTMTDALGLHVMGTRSINSCWSTDFHLGLTGVQLVINQ